MRLITALVFTSLLTACAEFPGVYKIDVEQGNIITQEMVDQLRPGMTKRQVRFILGSPMIEDTFNQHRWDFVYTILRKGKHRDEERISVFFDANERLEYFTGDFLPSGAVPPPPEEPAADQQG